MRTITLGLLGLGNVGSGVVKLLADNAAAIEARLGARVEVKRIAVQKAEKQRLVAVDKKLVTTDARAVIDDPEVQVVVELIGGEEPAREYVLRAIEKGKHVVTANKALLAMRGDEIFAAAEKRGTEVYYEASVGGGIPIIRALREGLASDHIHEVVGIVNGTSNFILSKMTDEGRAFAEVLAEAQAAGYAEADPTLDVGGGDAAHKLAVLARLCFASRIDYASIFVEGIQQLTKEDIAYADKFGYVIKLLAIGKDHGDGGLELRVHPTMIPKRFLLATVQGVFNAVYVSSQALGQSMYYGRGAGMMPTAVAVVSDVIEIARNVLAGARPQRLAMDRARPARDIGKLETRYYLRFSVLDRPGVLAQLAGILGENQISIAQMIQEGRSDGDGRPVTVVILTHRAKEASMQAALAAIGKLPAIAEPTRLVRIHE